MNKSGSFLFALLGAAFLQGAGAAICYADSQQSLDNCVGQINGGTADKIEVTQNIYCTPNGAACGYLFRNLTNPARQIEIYGSNNGISIYRNPTISLFTIENSTNITIRNLGILDNGKRQLDYQSCSFVTPQTTPVSMGRNTLTGQGLATNITLQYVRIDTGEPRIIDIGHADNIRITNSTFSGSGHFGIWTSTQFPKTRLSIFDNTFTGIGANAIFIGNVEHAWIDGNRFDNNHATNPFCLPGGQHTGGGQIDIEAGTKNLSMQGNHIYNGHPSVSGIEFADGSVAKISGITIKGNYIYNNQNAAIFFNNMTVDDGIQDVVIRDNAFYGNGVPQVRFNGHRRVDVFENYYTGDLSQSPRASFAGTAKTCNLNGGTTCAVNVTWNTVQAGNVQVKVEGGGLFSTNANFSQWAPWLGAAGTYFEIFASTYSGNEPIARYFIKGN